MILNIMYFSQYQVFHDEPVNEYFTITETLKPENSLPKNSFHHQVSVVRGVFLDIAPDGGLLPVLPGNEIKAFYSGELD